jgi:hypothetical protein
VSHFWLIGHSSPKKISKEGKGMFLERETIGFIMDHYATIQSINLSVQNGQNGPKPGLVPAICRILSFVNPPYQELVPKMPKKAFW